MAGLDERTKIFGAIAIGAVLTLGVLSLTPQKPQQVLVTPEVMSEVDRLDKFLKETP